MSNIVHINESINLYGSQDNLTPEEYKSQLASIKSLDSADIDLLREQNTNLTKLLENTHYMHEKNWTELLQAREVVSDLRLDLEDEKIESELLREKLFATSDNAEENFPKEIKVRAVSEFSKLTGKNQELIARLLETEEKYSKARADWLSDKEKMLKQISKLKNDVNKKKSSPELQSQSISSGWKLVAQELPEESGIYLLTDGLLQCVGYFNCSQKRFSSTTYFSMPTHWMERPRLP